MITIDKLEIQFDVEAGDEHERFRELFNRSMQEWRQADAEDRRIQRMIDRDRGLGDRNEQENR